MTTFRPHLCLGCGKVFEMKTDSELCPKCGQADQDRADALARELKPEPYIIHREE